MTQFRPIFTAGIKPFSALYLAVEVSFPCIFAHSVREIKLSICFSSLSLAKLGEVCYNGQQEKAVASTALSVYVGSFTYFLSKASIFLIASSFSLSFMIWIIILRKT